MNILFVFIFLASSTTTITAKDFDCMTSGQHCSENDLITCRSRGQLPNFEYPHYISGRSDYCPETHTPPISGPSAQPGKLPCRHEDGYYMCMDHYPNDNCIRRTMVNSFMQHEDNVLPCRVDYDESYRFRSINCSDDEIRCETKKRCVVRHDINTIFGCTYVSRNIYIRCHDDEYKCQFSGRCIPRSWVRDGSVDCSFNKKNVFDSSDENAPLSSCDDTTEFRCRDESGRCIPRHAVRNGVNDCRDGSDESNPIKCHLDTEVMCSGNESRCISRFRVNDGFPDCHDSSDENVPNFLCHGDEFSCRDGRCIPRQWVGNALYDCKSRIDETINLTCHDTEEFQCKVGGRCISRKYLCDGIANCDDCSDEIDACDEPRMYRCRDGSKCIPWARTCDTALDCDDGSDENTDHLQGFKCFNHDRSCFVPQFILHDNTYSICDDRSDVCFQDDGEFVCEYCHDNITIISPGQICDGVVDCADLSDECLCESSPVEDLCRNIFDKSPLRNEQSCANLSFVCNGSVDCYDEIDERFCERNSSISNLNYVCDEIEAHEINFPHYRANKRIATSCDGFVECPWADDECWNNCTVNANLCKIVMYCQFQTFNLEVLGLEVCDGLVYCDDMSDELNCTERFYCDAGLTTQVEGTARKIVSIPKEKVCDLQADCLDMSDEMNCSTSTHFYCKNSQPPFVPRSKFYDGYPDCSDQSDECPVNRFSNTFISSPTELLDSVVMKVFIWITGSICLIGNTAVVKQTLITLRKEESFSVVYWNGVLLLNLATANLLMGAALVTIAIKSLQFSGEYCLKDQEWRTSSLCNAVGVMALVSMEVSVNILLIMSVFRVVTVVWMYKFRIVQRKAIATAILLAWLIGITFAALPLIKFDWFEYGILLSKNSYFRSVVVNKSAFDKFVHRSAEIGTKLSSSLEVKGRFGYFNHHAVCFPDFFSPSSATYSLLIVVYNAILMTLAALGYIIIYRWTGKKRKAISRNSSKQVGKQQKEFQGRIRFIVLTNVISWLPVFILSFFNFLGFYLHPIAFSISAVFLQPVNSAVDPIAFSMVHKDIHKKVNTFWRKFTNQNDASQNLQLQLASRFAPPSTRVTGNSSTFECARVVEAKL